MLDEGLITADTARARTALLNRDTLATPRIVAGDGVVPVPLARAVPASSGIASGQIALDEARVAARRSAGVSIVLLRRDAETSDLTALESAAGLLTQRGARTSHAAVVTRQLGKVCLAGCSDLQTDEKSRTVAIGHRTLREGDLLTLDGNEGALYAGAVQTELVYPIDLVARLESLRQGSASSTI
jgi:pyruvate, orthophosphate dikinase